jgi:hypothetical protein
MDRDPPSGDELEVEEIVAELPQYRGDRRIAPHVLVAAHRLRAADRPARHPPLGARPNAQPSTACATVTRQDLDQLHLPIPGYRPQVAPQRPIDEYPLITFGPMSICIRVLLRVA